jgi:hypothetical protein
MQRKRGVTIESSLTGRPAVIGVTDDEALKASVDA